MKNDISFQNFNKIPDSYMDNLKELSDEEIRETANRHTGDFNNEDIEPPEVDLDDDETTETTEETGEENLSNTAGDLVTGEFVVDLIDAMLPAIIVTTIHFVGYKMDKKELQLTIRERKTLSKATQRALNSINVDLENPINNLILVSLVIYGSKIISAIPEMQKIDKKRKIMKTEEIEEIKDLAQPTDEQLFNADFEIMQEEVVKQGRKKTKFAAKKMLLKENLDAVNALREKHNLEPYEAEEKFSL